MISEPSWEEQQIIRKNSERIILDNVSKENEELKKWIEADNEEINNITPVKGKARVTRIKAPEPAGNNYYDDISNCY